MHPWSIQNQDEIEALLTLNVRPPQRMRSVMQIDDRNITAGILVAVAADDRPPLKCWRAVHIFHRDRSCHHQMTLSLKASFDRNGEPPTSDLTDF